MTQKGIDINKLAKYEDQYVALSQDKNILAVDKTIKGLENKLKKLKTENVAIQYIPPLNVSLSPVCQ